MNFERIKHPQAVDLTEYSSPDALLSKPSQKKWQLPLANQSRVPEIFLFLGGGTP